MLDRSPAYLAAITASGRRILMRATVKIVDPDIVYQAAASSGEASYSRPAQLYDGGTVAGSRYVTPEHNRWLLDGSFRAVPDNPQAMDGQIGHVGDVLSGVDGTFPSAVWVEERFTGVDVLQSCTVFFQDAAFDGVPVDFTVEIRQGGTVYHTESFTGNTASSVTVTGFTVHNPDAIRVTVTRWSLPSRRLRVMEIIPGVWETWGLQMVADLNIVQQGDVSCMSLPYGTCTLKLDNTGKRFEPRNKASLFRSIEERQAIRFEIGVRLASGDVEWMRVGTYYQMDPGWKTSGNEPTITWDLVDIIGLLADRTFIPPSTLPTTLAGWIAAIVAHLGVNFAAWYHVDPEYAGLPVTADSAEDVTGKKCGDILRWACQATGTWPRADNESGYLTVEPLWSQGGRLTLRDIQDYPTMSANGDIAMLIFYLHDGADTQYVVTGNNASAAKSCTIDNPFIHTADQALTAARMILSTYGGNKLETTGRGDPSAEIGDVDTVWLDESAATTGRRIYQTLRLQDGYLQGCQSRLLQADGSFLFQECVLLTEDCTWTVPAGVTRLRVVLGQGGQGGGKGQDGWIQHGGGEVTSGYGEDGVSGSGGRIWYGTIDINPQQQFAVQIGHGGVSSDTYGVAGAEGGHTTFGPYSSANGKVYPNGYTDIANGDSYGRTGVETPANGTSDGAAGGKGGEPGAGHYYEYTKSNGNTGRAYKEDVPPGPGKSGKQGADGFVLVYWDKEETT